MDFIIELLAIYLFLFIGYLVQLPIHEGGHLLFGLLTGYRFVSFRIGSLTLASQQGQLMWKRFRIPGTLGQCLMDPPEPVDGRYPAALYHLGGSLLNLFTGALCFAVFCLSLTGGAGVLSDLFLGLSMAGFLLGICNLLPIRTGGVATDGYNARHLGKDPLADRGFWLQLRINALQTDGERLRDMRSEYFTLPSDADLSNVHISSWAYFRFCWLFDRQDFTAATDYAHLLLTDTGSKLLGFYQNELRCELFFLRLLDHAPREELDTLYDKALQKHVKATASYLSRQRLLYAYAKTALRDDSAAQAALTRFEQICKTHPFPGEIEGERELLALVDART